MIVVGEIHAHDHPCNPPTVYACRLASETVRLVHPALPHNTAEALGVKSLRYRQQVGAPFLSGCRLPCRVHQVECVCTPGQG